MKGKKSGQGLSDSPEAKRKRAARARAAAARAAEEAEEAGDPPADTPADGPPEPAPEAPVEAERTTVQLGTPELIGDGPELPPPPGISVKAAPPPVPISLSSRSPAPSGGRDSAWHRKWKAQLVGGGGREEACELGAQQIVNLLTKLEDMTRACGKEPQVTAEHLRPAIVLALDQLMPQRAAELLDKPIVHVGLGIAMMAGQTAGAVHEAKTRAKNGQPPLPPKPKPGHLTSVPMPTPTPEPPKVVPVMPVPPAPPAPAPAPSAQQAQDRKLGEAIAATYAAPPTIPTPKMGDPDMPSF